MEITASRDENLGNNLGILRPGNSRVNFHCYSNPLSIPHTFAKLGPSEDARAKMEYGYSIIAFFHIVYAWLPTGVKSTSWDFISEITSIIISSDLTELYQA